jgi:hypothetical protein
MYWFSVIEVVDATTCKNVTFYKFLMHVGVHHTLTHDYSLVGYIVSPNP